MRVFHFHPPSDGEFAEAGRIGTWVKGTLCPACGCSTSRLISPLVIEWLPGSDVVGDFTWPLPEGIIVSDRARRVLGPYGVGFSSIEMRQDPKAKRPQRVTKRTRPRIWLPYDGPPLWELVPIAEVVAFRRSGACPSCGREFWAIPPHGRLILVHGEAWRGVAIFRIRGSNWVYCTEEVKAAIESAGLTNIVLEESGSIVE